MESFLGLPGIPYPPPWVFKGLSKKKSLVLIDSQASKGSCNKIVLQPFKQTETLFFQLISVVILFYLRVCFCFCLKHENDYC